MNTSGKIKIKLIKFNSKEYQKEIQLRNETLRLPLGLDIKDDDLSAEENDTHIAAYIGDELVGITILTPLSSSEVKMRAVGVSEAHRNKGIATKLIMQAEQIAIDKGFKLIVLNAREKVIPLYERLGYEKIGNMFIEVTIPHFKMQKHI